MTWSYPWGLEFEHARAGCMPDPDLYDDDQLEHWFDSEAPPEYPGSYRFFPHNDPGCFEGLAFGCSTLRRNYQRDYRINVLEYWRHQPRWEEISDEHHPAFFHF